MGYPGCILVWFGKGGVILDGSCIEDSDISKIAFLQDSTLTDTEVVGRERGQAADGFLLCDNLFVAYVFTQQAGKVAIGTRMGIG